MADHSGKTEEPTQRRLEKARREGQFPQAKEFVSGLQFLLMLALLASGGAAWFQQFQRTTRWLLALAFREELAAADCSEIAWRIAGRHFLPLAAAGLGVVAATLGLRLLTTRFGLSFKKLAPDAERLNPVSRLRELPRQNLSSLLQTVILLPLFLWAVVALAEKKWNEFLLLPLAGVEVGFARITASLMDLFWNAAALFMVFGCVDLFRQLRRHRNSLRMSKQELKEELKDQESNPQMKARIRRLQRDRARRRMMKELPKATAVIVNPTHFAVAIRYQMESMAAPSVVAKGKNYLALRIRQKAVEHGIPIVENPPLAQALYRSADVGQEIPPHLYRAVAEILAYIFKLMKGRLPG
jgi:flagellar biosynthetic protein FlhB